MPADRSKTAHRPRAARVPVRISPLLLVIVLGGFPGAPGAIAPAMSQPAEPRPAETGSQDAVTDIPGDTGRAGTDPAYEDPFDAYDAGAWDQALEGFLNRRVAHPEDLAETLNVGSAHYQKGDFDQAARAFTSVISGDGAPVPQELRQKALYNLGNTAYRQGKLTEAVELYRQALELDSDDQDSKLNLEFVLQEIERRQQKQQQQGQGSEQDPEQQQDQGSQDQNPQDQGSQGQDPQQEQSPREQNPQEQGEQDQSPQSREPSEPAAPEGPDQDADGIPDRVEREGENPTDPANPDTDGDGLQDGAEDLNANGRVDPRETDPNRSDTDGDGVPDGEEQAGSPAGAAPTQAVEGLTEDEALRYLMALEEVRPEHRPETTRSGQPTRSSKDW